MILPSRQRVGSILIVNNDDNTSTLEVKDSGGREMTAEFLAQVNAGESTAVSEAISSAIAEQHESDLDTFASPTDVATAISDQHTTDLGIFSTPASVATAISAQHETDNATYVRGQVRSGGVLDPTKQAVIVLDANGEIDDITIATVS